MCSTWRPSGTDSRRSHRSGDTEDLWERPGVVDGVTSTAYHERVTRESGGRRTGAEGAAPSLSLSLSQDLPRPTAGDGDIRTGEQSANQFLHRPAAERR